MDNKQTKKAWYKRVWVWIGIVLVLGVIGAASGGSSQTTPKTNQTTTPEATAPKEEPKPTKWDVEAAYAKINNGMTKAEVEEATGKTSDSCTESEMEHIGKTETCSYGNAFIDKATIMVIYSNDAVSSKTKSNY